MPIYLWTVAPMVVLALAIIAAPFVWRAGRPVKAGDVGAYLAATLFFAACVFVAAVVISLLPNMWIDVEADEYLESRHDIVLMKDDVRGSGSFALFIGSYSENNVFSFYQRDETGKTNLMSVDADDAFIYEDSGKPYVEKICGRTPPPGFAHLKSLWGTCHYEFHIPEGSIAPGIELDARGDSGE